MSDARGTIYSTGGGTYTVRLDSGEMVEATLRGRLKREPRAGGRVVIGDRVSLSGAGGDWTLESVDERTTQLARRGRGAGPPKVLVANLDRVFAVVAVRRPDATPATIDRLLVLIEASGMHPALVLNKVDLEGAAAAGAGFAEVYRAVGYEVLLTSAKTGEGLDDLRAECCSGSSALIGPSGVGKSSLLNALEPELELRTGELSRATKAGRHTTVGSRMIPLACGGVVADTPGFSDIGLWSVGSREVADCFPELRAHAEDCRFRGCSHLHEPGCAVRAALAAGEISEDRYRSYAALHQEAVEAAKEV